MTQPSASRPDLRLPLIDGARGYLIFAMTVGHIASLTGLRELNYITHKPWAVFLTGEGFMAISGFMCGYILSLRQDRYGFSGSLTWGMQRVWKIIRYYLLVFVLCALPAFVLPLSDTLAGQLFHGRASIGASEALLFAAGLFRPSFYDILYLYVICIALSPLALWVLKSRFAPLFLGVSALAWLATQYGLTGRVLDKLYEAIPQIQSHETGAFHLFAWQLLFFVALWFGHLFAQDRDVALAPITKAPRAVFTYAVTALAVFAVPGVIYTATGFLMNAEVYLRDYLIVAPLPLINFAIAMFVLLFVLTSPSMQGTWGQRLLTAVLSFGFFRVIGQKTLQTFATSIVVSYWVAYSIPAGSEVTLSMAAIYLALCMAVVYAVALALAYAPPLRKSA
jgi:hypothetical protein